MLSSYFRILLIVQRLREWVRFANKRVHQKQEQHVGQQCTKHRQENDDGHLKQTTFQSFCQLSISISVCCLKDKQSSRHDS